MCIYIYRERKWLGRILHQTIILDKVEGLGQEWLRNEGCFLTCVYIFLYFEILPWDCINMFI